MIDAEFPAWPVYGLARTDKRALLAPRLAALTRHHREHCQGFDRLLTAHGHTDAPAGPLALEDLPLLPVRLFKLHELRSVGDAEVFKVLTSSGTSGQAPSRIVLDKRTASWQTTALVRIMQEFIGKARLPMLYIDHPGVIKDRRGFSARGAGILGMANFGRDHRYALSDEMVLDRTALHQFAERHRGQPVLLFGFTFMVWQHFVRELERSGETVDLSGAILIHSGGWKKLQDQAVDNASFKQRLRAVTGIARVHNFYGMVEQVGSVFVECEEGHLHAPAFADVLFREPGTWRALGRGEKGLIQVLSCLPQSYPGHSLLTEDLGTLTGEDDCPCGRLGRYFRVEGRLPKAEVRGCSDTQPDPDAATRSGLAGMKVPR